MRKVPNEICWNVSHDSRMLYSKRLARFAWNTKRFTGNIKLFTGNDSRLTRTVNRLQETILALVAPFVGVLVRFNVCKYPDYLVVFGTSPYIRCFFFVLFEPSIKSD